MPRAYKVLLALVGGAWAALTLLTIPDGFPEEIDPYGYRLLIAHGTLPSFVVPIGLVARACHHLTTGQTIRVLAAPLAGVVAVVLAWSLLALPTYGASIAFSYGLEIAISAVPLYLILGIVWAIVVGFGMGVARLLTR